MGYDVPFNDFTIRQYGPFSRSVACSLDILKGAEFVVENKDKIGEKPDGDPVLQYSYTVRDDNIKKFLRDSFDVSAPQGHPSLDVIGPRLKKEDRKVLEVTATRLFLEQEMKLSGEKLNEELHNLKGHLKNSFKDAEIFLTELRSDGLL